VSLPLQKNDAQVETPIMNKQNIWTVRWLKTIDEVAREQWDRLAQPLATPLLEWQWLHELEASGSIAPQHGWHPCHLTFWDGQTLVAAAPLYVKTHSEGEFVFDHWWAQLAKDYGISYYPKLVGMSPVTPAIGYRILTAEGIDNGSVVKAMVSAIDGLCTNLKIACCHFNFIDAPWFEKYSANSFTAWHHQSYLWRNTGYATFEDYLAIFRSTQRRNIRREMKQMEKAGIQIKALTGDAIPSELAAVMYQYYLRTNAQYGPWAARYLNAEFFERIFRSFRHRLLVMAAYRPCDKRQPVALSMLLHKNHHLIGRYWGGAEHIKDLHFNMCFYAPIQWAIENGIQTFDPGAGSAHKIYRGFEAVSNTSLHRFYDPRLKLLFEHLIGNVNQMEEANIAALNRKLPFAQK
jgi:predicted N-acyltransferase